MDTPPVKVTVDVQRISWRRQSEGRYSAFALMTFPCLDCDKTHTFEHQLEAPRVFIRDTFKCKTCGNKLEVEDENIEYYDSSEKGPHVEVTAKLVCRNCATGAVENFDIPSPSFSSLKHQDHIDIDLAKSSLRASKNSQSAPSLHSYRFDIALSFPGKRRDYVKSVREELKRLKPDLNIFYDDDFKAELARPNLDSYLQDIYMKHSRLIVIFLSPEYEQSEWCGLEWRAIRDLIKKKNTSTIMLMRFEEVEVPGLLSIDGYISLKNNSPEIAAMLIERRFDFEFLKE